MNKPYFTMQVEMGNAAFEDNNELPRILRETASKIEQLCSFPFILQDVYGNFVGTADIVE